MKNRTRLGRLKRSILADIKAGSWLDESGKDLSGDIRLALRIVEMEMRLREEYCTALDDRIAVAVAKMREKVE